MEELVFEKRDKALCSSKSVAEKFRKHHKNVLGKIDGLIESMPKNEQTHFYKSEAVNEQNGESYPIYLMDRDGYSLLAMGFTGNEAMKWKLNYIHAFDAMESALKERNTELWVEQRQQGKLTRKSETDEIQLLIEYAKTQGSTHANMLYMTYSKLANKMAGISDRDTATFSQLNNLSFIENIILNQIRIGMERCMGYKDIYRDCKRQIELFKDIAYLETA